MVVDTTTGERYRSGGSRIHDMGKNKGYNIGGIEKKDCSRGEEKGGGLNNRWERGTPSVHGCCGPVSEPCSTNSVNNVH